MSETLEKRKRGRPATGKRPYNICLPLSEAEKNIIEDLAKKMNSPRATLMRNLIFQFLLIINDIKKNN